jgi:hypothetical protein
MMFKKATVSIKFRDQLIGGIPKSKKLLKSYLEAKFGELPDDFADRLAEEVKTNDLEEKQEILTTGFKRDDIGGLYLSDYQVKAMLKQCASLLKITVNTRGSKQIFAEGLVIRPVKLYLGRMEPDGIEEFCGNVTTMQGKRSILRNGEFVREATLDFEIWILDVNIVTMKQVEQCLTLGQEVGLGSCRSFEKGKYDLLSFEPTPD